MFTLIPSKCSSHIYLKPISNLISDEVTFFTKQNVGIDRISQDGIITLIGYIGDKKIGLIYQDFRVNGASISKENAQRIIAFTKELKSENMPLVFLMNSLGVRITQGRTIFNDAFSVIPSLFELKNSVPLITVALGGAIGINAIYFAQGHYRIAVETSAINLAGPEVHRRFFGDKNLSFHKFAPASHQILKNTLVHETTPNISSCFDRIKQIISFIYTNEPTLKVNESDHRPALTELLSQLGEEEIELFKERGADVKIFITKVDNSRVGYILNPPARPNNLLTVASIDKTIAALDFFKSLKIPVISIIDCPGGDPRQGESDADSIVKMTELVRKMIEYPFAKMGILYGRCFGGSGMFSFPQIYGGNRIIAVEGSQLGIMNEVIIKELLSNSPRLLNEWLQMHVTETSDLRDMVEAGCIQKIIPKDLISFEIRSFLYQEQIEQNNIYTQINEKYIHA